LAKLAEKKVKIKGYNIIQQNRNNEDQAGVAIAISK